MKKNALIFVFVLLIPVFSRAEDPGRIQGQVTKAGKPVGGVDVVLKELSLSTITDKNGVYTPGGRKYQNRSTGFLEAK